MFASILDTESVRERRVQLVDFLVLPTGVGHADARAIGSPYE
jgi:hypothetical protein